MDIYGIKPYLDRAKAHIESPEDHVVRYAALELRFCMETIAYRQLQQYGDVVPGSIIGAWKPDQIMRMLATFDPDGNTGGELSFATRTDGVESPTEWIPLGESRTIPWKNFRKMYQKLGSYLHMPAPKTAGEKAKSLSGDSLSNIVKALEEVLSSTIILAVKKVICAKCDCGTIVYIGENEFLDGEFVFCSNTKCNAIFSKALNDEGERVLERVRVIAFNCNCCEARVPFTPDEVLAPIPCPNCSRVYRLKLKYCLVEPFE